MTDTDGWIIPGITMTNTGPLLWNGYQKIPFFPDIWYLFCRRQLRPVHVLFFQNWLMKLKGPSLLKPLDTIIQENYQTFYPSEPFRITRFQMRHPVLAIR